LDQWVSGITELNDSKWTNLRFEDFVSSCPFCLSGVVALRSALIRHRGFDVNLRRTSDWLMWAQMASRAPLGMVRDELVTYRVHGRNEVLPIVRSSLELTVEFLQLYGALANWVSEERGICREAACALLNRIIRDEAEAQRRRCVKT
jgi:hypothetical protein